MMRESGHAARSVSEQLLSNRLRFTVRDVLELAVNLGQAGQYEYSPSDQSERHPSGRKERECRDPGTNKNGDAPLHLLRFCRRLVTETTEWERFGTQEPAVR